MEDEEEPASKQTKPELDQHPHTSTTGRESLMFACLVLHFKAKYINSKFSGSSRFPFGGIHSLPNGLLCFGDILPYRPAAAMGRDDVALWLWQACVSQARPVHAVQGASVSGPSRILIIEFADT